MLSADPALTHRCPSFIFAPVALGAHAMPSFSVGLAQVEDRLRSVRRRLNLLIVQDAIYLAGSAVFAAAALLIGLSMWREISLPSESAWLGIPTVAIAGTAAALQMYRRWVSLSAVVHWADRRAELDDRLTTLLFDAPQVRTSSLHPVLLEQILAAAPRWDIDRLAPRRVPRSVFAFAAALAALIVTAYFARPPAVPTSAAAALHPQTSREAQDAAQPRGAAGSRPAAGQSGLGPSQIGRPAQAGTDGAQLAAAAIGDLGEHRNLATVGSGGDSRGAGRSSDPVNGGDGAEKDSSGSTAETTAGGRERLDTKTSSATDAKEPGTELRGNAPSANPVHAADHPPGSGTGTRPDAAASAPSASNSTGNRPSGGTGSRPGGGAAAAGGAPGAEATGLFAAQASGEAPSGSPHPMPVPLGAFSTLASTRSDPQRPDPSGGAIPGATASHRPATLPEEQIPDAPLQKADIAPEHEPLIRRIFTPEQ